MKTLEKGKKVTVKGACSYVVETAKNGSSFIKGEIADRGDVFPFKVWDATTLEVDLFKVVEITGVVKEYDGFCYIEGSKAANVLDERIEDYIESSKVEPAYMLSALREMVDTFCGEWKDIVNTALNRFSLEIACLPNSCHNERGGFLAHLYESLYLSFAECDRLARLDVQVNRKVVVAGLLLSKIYYLDNYEFNPLTGEVSEEYKSRRLLFGRTTSIAGFVSDSKGVVDNMDEYLSILNVISAVNGAAETVIPESVIVVDAFRSELRAFESSKVYSSLEEGSYAKTGNMTIAKL